MNTILKVKEINIVGKNILLTGELLKGNVLIGMQLQNEEGLIIKVKGIGLGLIRPINIKNSNELTINIESNKEKIEKFKFFSQQLKNNQTVIFFTQ